MAAIDPFDRWPVADVDFKVDDPHAFMTRNPLRHGPLIGFADDHPGDGPGPHTGAHVNSCSTSRRWNALADTCIRCSPFGYGPLCLWHWVREICDLPDVPRVERGAWDHIDGDVRLMAQRQAALAYVHGRRVEET